MANAAINYDGSLSFVIEGPAVIVYDAQDCNPTGYKPYTVSGLLGFTDGGVSISNRVITHRINGDEFGGSEGVPAELLILGGQASIRTTIVKWNKPFTDIAGGAYGVSQEGEIPGYCKPYFGSNCGFSFWVVGRETSYYFPKCELASQPREWNVSSHERRMQLNINAYNVFDQTNQRGVTFFKGTQSFTDFDPACQSVIISGGDSSGGGDSGSGSTSNGATDNSGGENSGGGT